MDLKAELENSMCSKHDLQVLQDIHFPNVIRIDHS